MAKIIHREGVKIKMDKRLSVNNNIRTNLTARLKKYMPPMKKGVRERSCFER